MQSLLPGTVLISASWYVTTPYSKLRATALTCSPRFGIGHAMCLGLAPWMAAEIPHMVDNGVISNDS